MADVRHSPLTWRLFDAGYAVFRRGFLRATRFGGRWPDPIDGQPILLVANHVSWWDGFLLREVQRTLRPDAPFHTVVVEHQLDRHPILRHLGGVPVDPTRPASVLGMMRTLARLRRDDPTTVLSYFPQGRIWPSSRRPLAVKRGIEAVSRLLAPVRILPVSIHIEPLVDVRPTPFLWLGDPVDATRDEPLAPDELDHLLARGLDEIRTRLDGWGEDVAREWPDAPATCPSLRAGTADQRRPASDRPGTAPLPDLTRTSTTSP